MKNGFFVILAMMAMSATKVLADVDESYRGYDEIVAELKGDVGPEPQYPRVDWDEVALHGQVGFATSYLTVNTPDGASGTGILKGIEFGVGANLFSKVARAEIIFRNFAQEALETDLQINLKELEGRIIFLPRVNDTLLVRMGPGLSKRFMEVSSQNSGRWNDYAQSAYSTSFLLGFEKKFNRAISLGPDFAYRTTIDSDSYDKTTWDAILRMNATF